MNSPIKPPTQSTNKDGTPNVGRRTSVSQGQSNTYGNDVGSGRPGTRRRDSGDLLRGNSLTSPTSRFPRDDPSITSPSTLTRRKTDIRDNGLSLNTDDRDQNMNKKEYTSPFAALKRTATGPVSAGLNGPSSPWSNTPQSAHLSNMGNFGSFSMAPGPTQPATPGEKKSGFASLRGESRFKGLMSNDNADETRNRMREKGSLSSLERLLETSNEQGARGLDSPRTAQSRRFPVSGSGDEATRTGSAALGGDDASPPQHDLGVRTGPNAQSSYEDIGFSSLDLPSDPSQRRDFLSQMGQQVQQPINEPPSPTITNPYQSPQASGANMLPRDLDLDDSDDFPNAQPSIPMRNLQTQVESMSMGDRSQTSSTGPPRQYPSLGGFGGLGNLAGSGPWSAAPGSGPSRAYPPSSLAIGESILSPLDGAGAPQHQGSRFFDASGSAPIGMPRQSDQDHGDQENAQHFATAPGGGRVLRDTDSPMRSGRGVLDDLFTNIDNRRSGPQVNDPNAMRSGQGSAQPTQGSFSSAAMPVGTPSSGWPGTSYFGRSQEQEHSTPTSQLPNAQQRQMVMPDRMRWIYRDPSGNTQGPWSGLEMHDWYKAGFFSPELQVKKLEDNDYEPLAQLIRRIGNSREPFLVPQIGIAHGPATSNAAAGAVGSSAPQAGPASSAQPPSAQPPFASSFPSFGTTLTAEQQNALERRKQEEQYLMARQKEHLAQQQVLAKMNMHNQQLHHHSSAHSLQSQPSYGSMTSPSAYQTPMGPVQPPAAGFSFLDQGRSGFPMGPAVGAGPESLGRVREEDTRGFIERVNAQRGGQAPYDGPFQSSNQMEGMSQQKQVNAMLQDRAYLQQEQDRYNALQGSNEDLRGQQRLEQFRAFQSERSDEMARPSKESRPTSQQQAESQQAPFSHKDFEDEPQDQPSSVSTNRRRPQSLSLTEQVQEAASKPPAQQTQSPWAKVPSGITQPMLPPQSASPLPAPAAQRNRQHVADALHADLRLSPEPSSAGTPSANIAPWAKETNESSKGPSLKEIQAMEAKKAAQAEEIAVAQRKAQIEEERRNQPALVATAPGLPSSANWASSVSPGVPAATTSPWAKGVAPGKPAAQVPAGSKKTLAQIQKEEEVRKQRAAAQAAVANASTMATAAPVAGGKRYADLASKTIPAAPQATSNIWTTVCAGGKVRTPSGAAPAPVSRTVSGATVTPVAATKPKPAASAKQIAQDDLQKWTKNALSKGLNPSITGS